VTPASEDRRELLGQALGAIDRLRDRLRDAEGALREPIAVTGLGCRFPGGAHDPASYWRLLDEGRDAIVDVPASRWDAGAYHCEDHTVPGTIRFRAGGFLAGWEPDRFDAAFFGISAREAVTIDPQQRLLLEVAWEALEHAGLPAGRLRGSRTGVFVGLTAPEYAITQFRDVAPEAVDAYSIFGCLPAYAAGRISYVLGLQGPSVALDTACSSSLTAVHLACQSLRTRECDVALAGGASLLLLPETSMSLSRYGGLSADGRCRTFDAAADGYGRGEGCGVVVLARLSDALRDGATIHGLIRGTAVNQDGPSSGITVPNGLAQEALIREALERSGLAPSDIDYVEAHGTATPLGDPIELEALGAVFGEGRDPDRPLVVGSVKTNLGHTEAAAGVAGLVKVLLALRHRRIPPHLHHRELTPRISARAARVVVPAAGMPWPDRGRPARAGVSAFGISGTNAHVVVEQAPEEEPVASEGCEGPVLVALSGATEAGLRGQAAGLLEWLRGPGAGESPRDVADTLGRRRTHLAERLAVVAESREELERGLEEHREGSAGAWVAWGRAREERGAGVVWVFSGHGSQWAGMGAELLERERAFREVVEELEPVVAGEAGFSLLDALGGEVHGMGRSQPAIYAMQLGLSEVWRGYGVRPAAVMGHSMGEITAAVVSGALSREAGARVICRRGRLMERLEGRGTMALLELGEGEVERRLAGREGISVAVSASPRATVVSGTVPAVDALVAECQAEGLLARRVRVDVPAHGPLVEPLLEELRAELGWLEPGRPELAFYSTALEEPRAAATFDAGYWARNLRRPVRLGAAVRAAAEDGLRVFVEVSPHPVVERSLEETLEAAGVDGRLVAWSLRREQPARRSLLTQLGRLHCHGLEVDWERLHPGGRQVELPVRAWEHRRYWLSGRRAAAPDGHPLLGTHVRLPGGGGHVWQAEVSVERLPWLADHRSEELVVMPGTGYCEMALAAAAEGLGAKPEEVVLRDVDFQHLLVLDRPVTVTTTLREEPGGAAAVEVWARGADGAWVAHARARAAVEPAPAPPPRPRPALEAAFPVGLEPEALYARLRAAGQHHGPAFAGVTRLAVEGAETSRSALGWVRLPDQAAAGMRGALLHPVVLDACLQVLGAVPAAAGDLAAGRGVLLPVGIGALRRHGDPRAGTLCRADLTGDPGGGRLSGRIELLADDGRVLVTADDVELAWLGGEREPDVFDPWLYELAWEAAPAPAATPEPGGWFVAGDPGDDLAGALAAALGATRDDDLEAAIAAGCRGVVLVQPPPEAGGAADLDAARDRVMAAAEAVQAIVRAGRQRPPRLWVVTRGAQQVLPGETVNLSQSALRGLVRTLAHEHPELRATVLDAGPGTGPDDLVRELLAGGPDDEVAYRACVRHVARLEPASGPAAGGLTRRARCGRDGFRLESARPGMLDSLELRPAERRPPGPGEVEIRVAAAGLNFSDVLKAMGSLRPPPGDERPMTLGGECAGRVAAVGPGVTGLAPGDEVLAIAWGSLGSFVTTRAELVLPIPAGMAPAEAAAIPIVHLTAWYALRHVAGLAPGERVLVHSATGGVGLAAIAIARLAGAEVLATAGTEAKRGRLRAMGVEHVMDSRGLAFAGQVMEATGGRGVDVVLNSLAGEALRLGLSVLAPHGRFIELGKRDIHDDARLGILPFNRGLTFSAVDADLLARTRPALARRVLEEVMAAFAAGDLGPLPRTEVPLERAAEAFQLMARAGHVGKVVLAVPAAGDVAVSVPPGGVPFVRPGGGYVVTGGLSGLGLHAAAHLAAGGAGCVVLNARSEPSPEADRTIGTMRAAGARVVVVRGDVAEAGTAERLVGAVAEAGFRLRGVLHSAAALDDCAVLNLDAARLRRAWWPKAVGAWRLHEATEGRELDWWIAYSSSAALLGAPGQGNYAAANAWVDGLARWRRARGLPALSVAWGPWAEIGLARGLHLRGYAQVEPAAGMAALQALIERHRTCTGVIPFEPAYSPVNPALGALPLFARLAPAAGPAGGEAGLRGELEAAGAGPRRRELLETHVSEQVRTVLRLGLAPIDHHAPVAGLGFDSLMALELRARLEAGLGLRLPATLVWAHPSVAALAANLAERLGLALDGPAGPAGEDELLAEILAAAEPAAAPPDHQPGGVTP
jgi:acyl transferase domain-containing protein/acyl carrier protein